MGTALDRIGVVAHPRREVKSALETVREWASRQGADVVQIRAPGHGQEVAPAGSAADTDLIVALGGDGTTLAAMHAAAPAGVPVFGVACGSLGALTTVTAEELDGALQSMAAGEWEARTMPGLVAELGSKKLTAINDLVFIRRGAGQVSLEVRIDGELLIRFAGDGLVAATPLGSTAYTLAVGGPMLAPGMAGIVVTPLAPHGGVCPPAVAAESSRVDVLLNPGYGGARIEIDGQIAEELTTSPPVPIALSYTRDYATLVSLGHHESPLAALRRRRILVDSPRVLARDERTKAAATVR
jgi:NAD+ kinase